MSSETGSFLSSIIISVYLGEIVEGQPPTGAISSETVVPLSQLALREMGSIKQLSEVLLSKFRLRSECLSASKRK